MKKFLAIALVVAFAVAIMPATLAAPAKMEGKVAEKMAEVENRQPSEVSKKYQTMRASDFETKTGWRESFRAGVDMMEPEETLLSGYWFESDKFTLANDWFTDGREVYTQIIQPADSVEGSEIPELHQYAQGETVWFNYDLYKTWDSASNTLIPLDKKPNGDGYSVQCYCFAGTYEDFTSDDPEGGLRMVNSWQSGKTGVGVKMTAPEDNYVYMFVMVIDEPQLTEFGAWLTLSYVENEFKKTPVSEEKLTVGGSVTADLSMHNEGQFVLAPFGHSYMATYAQAFEVELEAGKDYVAMVEGPGDVGATLYFCDENMDILNRRFVAAQELESGSTYGKAATEVMPSISGKYYIVLSGFGMEEGEYEVSIYNWNDVANPLQTAEFTIDLGALNTEDIVENASGGTAAWGYFWYADAAVGELILMYPGNYTLVGENPNVFVDAYDGVNITYKNATSGALWFANSWAPVTVNVVGQSKIEDNYFGYAIYNYEDCNAGFTLLGEELTVEAPIAFITDACPVHIGLKKLTVNSLGAEGSYPIGIWVTGKNHPMLTLGDDAKFDGDNKLTTMWYDANAYFHFGYTVSPLDELRRQNYTAGPNGNQSELVLASQYFELTTAGTFIGGGSTPIPPEPYIIGDANGDGKVNTGDATMILKYVAELVTLEGTNLEAADMNEDGKVNTGDATAILKYVVGQ